MGPSGIGAGQHGRPSPLGAGAGQQCVSLWPGTLKWSGGVCRRRRDILGDEKLAHSKDQISKHIEYVGPTIPLQPKPKKNKLAHNKMLQNSSFGKSEKNIS